MKYREKWAVFKSATLLLTALVFGIIIGRFSVDRGGDNAVTEKEHFVVKDRSPDATSMTKPSPQEEKGQQTPLPLHKPTPLVVADYISTFRSCLGKECFDSPVRYPDGSSVERIGLLAPMMTGGDPLKRYLDNVLHKMSSRRKISLVYDTHVPAYGYGKNHGWSRIIRLSRRLFPHAYALISNGYTVSETSPTDIYSAQVSQLVRWHCRLSHVAAHTMMLTVFVEDLLENPAVEIEKILTFIGVKVVSRPDMINGLKSSLLPALFADLDLSVEDLEGISNYSSISSAIPVLSSSSLGEEENKIQQQHQQQPQKPIKVAKRIPENLWHVGITTLEIEMKHSNGLTKWPCDSFRDIDSQLERRATGRSGGERVDVHHDLSSLPMTAQMLAANCTDPFVTCSVPTDIAGG